MEILRYLWIGVSWALFIFWIWMLIDCINNEDDKTERVTWALFIFFIPPLFVPLYYFQRYRPRKKEKRDDKSA